MSQNLVNQYIYKINELKLGQDLKIMESIKRDFDNRCSLNKRKFNDEMITSCKKFQINKANFQACKTFNSRLIQSFEEFGKQIAKKSLKSYMKIRGQLRENAFRYTQLQRFNLVVDYELMAENKVKTLEEETMRIKLRKFTLDDMR